MSTVHFFVSKFFSFHEILTRSPTGFKQFILEFSSNLTNSVLLDTVLSFHDCCQRKDATSCLLLSKNHSRFEKCAGTSIQYILLLHLVSNQVCCSCVFVCFENKKNLWTVEQNINILYQDRMDIVNTENLDTILLKLVPGTSIDRSF